MNAIVSALHQALNARRLPTGGFSLGTNADYSTEATGWALAALHLASASPNSLADSARLIQDQQADGRFALNGMIPESFWVTAPALLGLCDNKQFAEATKKGCEFLLKTTGHHFDSSAQNIVGHDTRIQGWPWTEGTHSWVDPTAYAMLALKKCGYAEHRRISEGSRMIFDRQLQDGGWNYGNSAVYGMPLRPLPENTATALCALAGIVPEMVIQKSLRFLQDEICRIRTPWTLSWGLLALEAWNQKIKDSALWLDECWSRRELMGDYTTSEISLMLIASQGWSRWMTSTPIKDPS